MPCRDISFRMHVSIHFVGSFVYAESRLPRLVDLLVPKSTGTSPCLGFLVAESCLGLGV